MDKDNQSPKIKLTIKMKGDKDKAANSSSTSSDNPEKVEINGANLPQNSSQEQVAVTSPGEVDDPQAKSEDNPYQIVVYNPEADDEANPNGDQPRSVPKKRSSSGHLPTIGSFTIQCSNCFKWRIIPTKEKYEEIREHIIENPFLCEVGKEWKPELSCEDPPDIEQDGTRLWAIDRPNIPRPPPGWDRLLRFRGEGSVKFADVYYVAPSGKRFRSMVEIQRYLDENPQYKDVSLTKFSFQIPKPLHEDYVRKRSSATDNGIHESAEATEGLPLPWTSQDEETEPQPNGSTDDLSQPENAAKKRKLSPENKTNDDLSPLANQNGAEAD